MTYDILGPGALDYVPCRYGTSKLTFRGPKRALEDPYVAFIGGTTTFGKFIEQPYPLRVEHLTGVPSVNFGQMNGGLDVFRRETVVLEAAQRARVTVLEVLGAANLSNRMYSVHPRRNDRFLRASPQLQRLYPEVDFTQFNFINHMLRHLFQLDADRFAAVQKILQGRWIRRMRHLLPRLSEEVILMRFGAGQSAEAWSGGNMWDAALITDEMLDELGIGVSAIIEVSTSGNLLPEQNTGLIYDLMQEEAAKAVLGPQVHHAAASALRPVLDRLM